METFATGLKRIKDLCDEAGCKVEFRIDKDDFVVVFYRNLREAWVPSNSETALNSVPNKASYEALNEALNENEKRL